MINSNLGFQNTSSSNAKEYDEEQFTSIPKYIQLWNMHKNKFYLCFLWLCLIIEFGFIIYISMIKPFYDAMTM